MYSISLLLCIIKITSNSSLLHIALNVFSSCNSLILCLLNQGQHHIVLLCDVSRQKMQDRLLFPANSLRQVQMLWPNRFALACHFQSFFCKSRMDCGLRVTSLPTSLLGSVLVSVILGGGSYTRVSKHPTEHKHGVLWRASAKARNIT